MFADKTNTFFLTSAFLFVCLFVFINIMEAPGRCWGCLRVEVLLIPSASHLHSSHAGPDVQPLSGVRILWAACSESEPPWGARGATGPCGHQHRAVAPCLGWWGVRREEGGIQGTPRVSRHKITHWSLWEPVALSPRHLVFFFFFWLFSGICCLFWETEKKAGRWGIRLGWIQSPGQPEEQHLGVHVHVCIRISMYPSSTAWLLMPHSWEGLACILQEGGKKPLRLIAGMYVLPGHYASSCPRWTAASSPAMGAALGNRDALSDATIHYTADTQ